MSSSDRSSYGSRGFRLIAIIFAAVAFVLVVVFGVVAFRTQAFVAASTTAPGQVIDLVPRRDCDRENGRDKNCKTVYAPRVRFTPAGGREVIFVSRIATSPPKLVAGDTVQVRYREDAPTDARIDSFTGVWLGALITGALALFFVGFAGIWIRLAVKYRVRPGQPTTGGDETLR